MFLRMYIHVYPLPWMLRWQSYSSNVAEISSSEKSINQVSTRYTKQTMSLLQSVSFVPEILLDAPKEIKEAEAVR